MNRLTKSVALGLAGLVVVTAIAGVVMLRPSASGQGGRREPVATSADSAAPAPTSGIPGATRDDVGAVRAALDYSAAAQDWLYLTDEQIRDRIADIASVASRDRLTDEVTGEVAAARTRLAAAKGPIWWFVRPLASRVETFDPAGARVSVWVVTILSAAGVAAPQAEWKTVTLDLTWESSRWRVDDVRQAPGPTPAIGPGDQPWDAEPLDRALDGYSRVDSETDR